MNLLNKEWLDRLIFLVIGSILTILGKIFLDKLRKKDVEKIRKINIIEDLVSKIDEVINILAFEIYMFVENQRMKMKGIKDLLETGDAEDFYGTTTKDRIKIIKELNSLIPKAIVPISGINYYLL